MKTFVLKKKKTYRRVVKLFMKDPQGKAVERTVTFTTEHLVEKDQRAGRARKVQAAFSTSNPTLINAIYADTGYGISFHEVGDEKGKLKRPSISLKADDFELMALRNLFEKAGLDFDDSKPVGLLNAEYLLYMKALAGQAGATIKSTAASIPVEKVDVEKSITEAAEAAITAYEEKSGEPVPDAFRGDLAFVDGLSNPAFDAKAYIAEKSGGTLEEVKEEAPAETKEALLEAYHLKYGKHVPSPRRNDLGWIKEKLTE